MFGIIAQGRLVDQAAMYEIRQTGSLEERFLATVGAGQVETQKLSWLED